MTPTHRTHRPPKHGGRHWKCVHRITTPAFIAGFILGWGRLDGR